MERRARVAAVARCATELDRRSRRPAVHTQALEEAAYPVQRINPLPRRQLLLVRTYSQPPSYLCIASLKDDCHRNGDFAFQEYYDRALVSLTWKISTLIGLVYKGVRFPTLDTSPSERKSFLFKSMLVLSH